MTTHPESRTAAIRQAPGKAVYRALRRLLRTRIVTGILVVLPIWVTWAVVKFVFNIMRGATQPLVARITKYMTSSASPVPDYVKAMLDWGEPVLAVLLTLFILYLLGLFTANMFGRRVLALMETVVDRVPIVKTIYRSTKQIVTTLSGQSDLTAGRVVMIEFPRPGMKCLGFMTSTITDQDTGRRLCTVFIPTTPNPTTGFMQIMPAEEVSETGWTVEDAVKIMMSGGVLCPREVCFDRMRPAKPMAPISTERVEPHPENA